MSMNIESANANYAKYANFTQPGKEGYSTQKIGTILAMQNIQAREYNPNGPGAPKWLKDRNGNVLRNREGDPIPVLDLRIVFVTAEGELLCWCTPSLKNSGRKWISRIQAGEKLKGHIHWDLQMMAPEHNMDNLIGKTILIATEEGTYGAGRPRPWHVAMVDDGPFTYDGELADIYKIEMLLADEGVSGGRPVAQAQPQQSVYQQPVQQPQQQYQQVPQQQWQPQPQMQQPMQQQPVYNQPGYQQAQQAQQFFAQGNPQAYAQVAQPQMVQGNVDPYETPWD